MALSVKDAVAAFGRTAEGMKGALAEAGPEIEVIAAGDAKKNVYDQVSPDGTPYPPLKSPRVSGGDKRLLDKGLLVASVSAAVTESDLVMRANAPGARVHHFGATIRPVKGKFLAFKVGGVGGTKRRRVANAVTVFARSVTVPGVRYLGVSTATAGRVGAAAARGFTRFVGKLLKG